MMKKPACVITTSDDESSARDGWDGLEHSQSCRREGTNAKFLFASSPERVILFGQIVSLWKICSSHGLQLTEKELEFRFVGCRPIKSYKSVSTTEDKYIFSCVRVCRHCDIDVFHDMPALMELDRAAQFWLKIRDL